MEKVRKKRSIQPINHKYRKPEVEAKVVDLRDDGKTWDEITEVIRLDLGEPGMSRTTTQAIYNRAIAKTVTRERRAGKKFDDHSNHLNHMYRKAVKVLGRWINAADKLSEELESAVDTGEINAIKAYGVLLKTAPQMKAISSEIRDYMKFHHEQQEKIKIEQKALVWDESQMLDYMDKYLQKLETEGKIRWIKPKI